MTAKIIVDPRLNIKRGVAIGPRVEADIRRRIREIEARWPAATIVSDRHELRWLRQLLKLVETRGSCDG
jgi:hypothetical protein